MVSSMPRLYFTPGRTRYPLYRRLGGSQGRSGTGGKSHPTGIRSPDRPARSSVTILTELPSPHPHLNISFKCKKIILQKSCNLNYSEHQEKGHEACVQYQHYISAHLFGLQRIISVLQANNAMTLDQQNKVNGVM